LSHEINPLKEQLQAHAQTTNILIAEKAELMAALTQSQKTAKQNSGKYIYIQNICSRDVP
jgi:hypothetical protein